MFYVRVEEVADGRMGLYMSVRTTSWHFDGERTDLHDLLSACWAVILRAREIASVRMHDVLNPAADYPGEIYARLLEMVQPGNGIGSADEVQQQGELLQREGQAAAELLASAFHLNVSCREQVSPHWRDRPHWIDTMCELLGEPADSSNYAFQARPTSQWTYFSFWERGVSGAEVTADAAALIRAALTPFAPKQQLEAVQRTVLVTQRMRNAYDFDKRDEALKLISLLDGVAVPSRAPLLVPIDSHLIGMGDRSIVIVRTDCGLDAFEEERLLSQRKRNAEAEIFLSDARFEWNDKIDEQSFEDMVLDLLRAQDGVLCAEQIGGVHDRDGGRDIIAEWNLPPDRRGRTLRDEGESEYLRTARRVLVQVKVRKTSVGKADLTDLRDRLEHHNCDGLLVVGFPRLTVPLIDHLDALRERGRFWVDRWERPRLELLLRQQVNIAARYQSLFQLVRDPQFG